jgi:hypothetical protein
MTDLEKVIKGLEETEIMLSQAVDRGGGMSVIGAFKCLNSVTDTIAMLKEQEPVEMEIEGGGSTWWYVCEECHGAVDRGDRFCRHCGRPLKQDTGGCNGCTYKGSEDCPLGFIDSGNFYCPNGKLI